MLKSTKLVLSLGILLGGSVAVLPTRSFAATSITSETVNVSATVNGYLAFTEISHTPGTGYSKIIENQVEKGYSGTFNPMDSTNNFGTTVYEVTCNYNSTKTPYVLDDNDYDNDGNTSERILAGAQSDGDEGFLYSSYVNTNCANGWVVKAKSTKDDGAYATMEPANTTLNPYKIKSTNPSTNPLDGTSANWLMKVAGVSNSKEIGSPASAATSYVSYADFNIIPAVTEQSVATGNPFQTVSSVANTYVGAQRFSVTYGFTAGMDAVADTYTGEIVYTLHVSPNV
ncbi:hypothetical protein IJ380_02725 [Candidatus Saccharibacteria bacterium]|nr:hypothetical protein [Candidatus Saccharibacteria bacterium]